MANVTDEQYIALCNYVQAQAEKIAGGCLAGSAAAVDRAGNRAAALCDYVADQRQRVQMLSEQTAPEAYDLGGLAVNLADDSQELGEL